MGRWIRITATTAAFAAGIAVGTTAQSAFVASADTQREQVFELRTYTAAEGKHDALLTRFRDHTMRIFEKHGMHNVGYWIPQDAPDSENTLIYLLSHASRDAANASWQAFMEDPEWQAVAEEAQRDGRLITGLERVYLDPADFSPMR